MNWVVLYRYKNDLFKDVIAGDTWQEAVDNFFNYAKEHEICFSGKIKCVKADDYFARLILKNWCKNNIIEELKKNTKNIVYKVKYYNGFFEIFETIKAVSALHAILEIFMRNCEDFGAAPIDFALLGCSFEEGKKKFVMKDEYIADVDVEIKNMVLSAYKETAGL